MEMLEQFAMYRFPQLSRQELEAMFEVADIKQTRVYQEALEEGLEKGLQKGIQKGLQAGSLDRAKAIALNMLNQGMSIEQISLLTELSEAEIRALEI